VKESATTATIEGLFQPFQIKNLVLKNRFVMAPMTRQHSVGNVPNQDNVDYYVRRAQSEVGLILTEGTSIGRPGSQHQRDVPQIYQTAALDGWKRVVDAVHGHGGKIAPQLWHVGLQPRPPEGYQVPGVGLEGPGTMSADDIHKTIAAFTQAAVDAQNLGFDAIELHGAHGYLIDQFFSRVTNTRTDEYGGKTIAERNRFAVDLLKSIRQAVGPELVVILRLSQWKSDDYDFQIARSPQELEEWLVPLAEAGADVLHMSARRYWVPEFEGSDLGLAGWAKKITGLPIIAVGSVGLSGEIMGAFAGENSTVTGLAELVRRYARGDFDMIAVGRALMQDPGWVKKVKEHREAELGNFTSASFGKYY
jgi:2,4-dienoyl-CoA reductase-like NADH-dependent reductase (Old Yellow Enzyme family)